jgi:hypothetical protein
MNRSPWVIVAAAAALLLLLNLGAAVLLWREPASSAFEAPEVWQGHGEASGDVAVEDAAAGIQRDLELGWAAMDRILEQRVRQACDEQGLDPVRALPDPALRLAVASGGAPSPADREAWLSAWGDSYRLVGLDPALLAGLATSSPANAAAP